MTKQKREAYYRRVYGSKTFNIQYTKKNGVSYFQGFNNQDQKVGRPIKMGADAHKLLAKMFPSKIPPVEGFVAGKDRLIRNSRANIARTFKARDWQNYGFTTARNGREFLKLLKPLVGNFSSSEELRKVVNKFEPYLNAGLKEYMDRQSHKIQKSARKFLSGVEYVDTTHEQYKGSVKSLRMNTRGNLALRKNGFYDYFVRIKPVIMETLSKFMVENHTGVGFWITTVCEFTNDLHPDKGIENAEIRATTDRLLRKRWLTTLDDVHIAVDRMIKQSIAKIENMLSNGSGWVLTNIKHTFLNMWKYTPKGGRRFFDLPTHFMRKTSLFIPQNKDDDFCAWYCCVYALEHKTIGHNASRISELKKFKNKYPIEPSLYPFELTYNQYNHVKMEDLFQSKIHIWFTDINDKHPPQVEFCSKNDKYTREIDLLLIQDAQRNLRHFALIKDVGAFRRNKGNNSSQTHVCRNCSRVFERKTTLESHQKLCNTHETTHITMPKEGSVQQFVQHSNKIPVPFTIIWDSETYNMLMELEKENTTYISRHVPSGAFAVVHDTIKNKVVKTFKYRGDTSIVEFIKDVKSYADDLVHKFFNVIEPIRMTTEDWKDFKHATHCYVCNGSFCKQSEMNLYKQDKDKYWLHVKSLDKSAQKKYLSDNKPPKCPLYAVKDHCHFTGKYRGACCNDCNLKLQVRIEIPVLAHNFKGYDSHFFVQALNSQFSDKVSVIPHNSEKFLQASVDLDQNRINKKDMPQLVFRDSYCHLSDRLEKLAENLDEADLITTKEYVRSISTDEDDFQRKFALCKEKGTFSYEYFDSLKKFEETEIPDYKYFVSSLEYHGVKFSQLDEAEQRKVRLKRKKAVEVKEVFGFKNLWEWHDHYMMLDVYLLNDVWQKYRKVALDKFGLDPSYYPTLPSFCWSAMLKMTGEKLELLTEHEMYMLLEEGKIGGISMVGTIRYAKANHEMLKDFDPSIPKSFIKYADVNGLYSWAMKQLLPHSDFKWADLTTFDLRKAMEDVDGEYGCFLKVDFPIPKALHDKFRDYPILPENLTITDEMLSPLQKRIKNQLLSYKNFNETEVRKLVPNLYDKKNYVIHIKHLKLALELCDGLVKPEDVVIHKVLSFKQKAWLKPYIDLCMSERQKATNDFDKGFWKLCSNSVFGKTMENVRDRMELTFYNDPLQFQEKLNDFRMSHYDIQNGTVAVYNTKWKTTLNKPIYAGVAILNLSKCLMYDIFYNHLKKQYGDDLTLLYTDTDSFIFQVYTDDFDRDINKELWDMCDYPPDNPLYSKKNKKVEGKIKDETHGVPIVEFAGNRAKQYAVRTDWSNFHTDDEEWLKDHPQKTDKCIGKGVAKSILDRSFFRSYADAINHNWDKERMCQSVDVYGFKSDKHTVYTVKVRKAFVSSFDDKRYLCDDGIHQLPYGHYKILATK